MYVKIKYINKEEKIKKIPSEYLKLSLRELTTAFEMIKEENNNILDIKISQYLKAA